MNEIYKPTMVKNGRKINKAYLSYIQKKDPMLCDSCDEIGEVASIIPLVSGSLVICKSCLLSIISEFDNE